MAQASTPVYEYRAYCTVHQDYVPYYGTAPPTYCPIDPAHPISGYQQLARVNPEARQVTDGAPTIGYFQTSSVVINIPIPTTVPATIVVDKIWPFTMAIWELALTQDGSNRGDVISIQVAPDTPAAYLTAPVSAGSTTINTSNTIFPLVVPGSELGITDGVSLKEYPGMVTAVDPAAGTITFSTPLVNSYAAGAIVLYSSYPVRNLYCDGSERMLIGNKGLRSRDIPANTPVKIIYEDRTPNTVATTVYLQMQYYFR